MRDAKADMDGLERISRLGFRVVVDAKVRRVGSVAHRWQRPGSANRSVFANGTAMMRLLYNGPG